MQLWNSMKIIVLCTFSKNFKSRIQESFRQLNIQNWEDEQCNRFFTFRFLLLFFLYFFVCTFQINPREKSSCQRNTTKEIILKLNIKFVAENFVSIEQKIGEKYLDSKSRFFFIKTQKQIKISCVCVCMPNEK